MTDSFVKPITEVTIVDESPWFVYIICRTYCSPFSSKIATFFNVTSCIFKLKDFNCSNFVVPFPYIELGH